MRIIKYQSFPFYSSYKSATVAVQLFPNVSELTCENTFQVMLEHLDLNVSVCVSVCTLLHGFSEVSF